MVEGWRGEWWRVGGVSGGGLEWCRVGGGGVDGVGVRVGVAEGW